MNAFFRECLLAVVVICPMLKLKTRRQCQRLADYGDTLKKKKKKKKKIAGRVSVQIVAPVSRSQDISAAVKPAYLIVVCWNVLVKGRDQQVHLGARGVLGHNKFYTLNCFFLSCPISVSESINEARNLSFSVNSGTSDPLSFLNFYFFNFLIVLKVHFGMTSTFC